VLTVWSGQWKTYIDFQIDKDYKTSERNEFFHPSIKASATDQPVDSQWTASGHSPVDIN